MRLDDLCDKFQALSFPKRSDRSHPDRALIAAARSSVGAAVVDDAFLARCMGLELDLIESDQPRRGLTPFFTMPDLGIRFAFGYWAPGSTAGAHEHTAWTITAVCRNELEVLTYDRVESYRRQNLVPKNRFYAPAGRAGFIFEPAIHEPRNLSREWSLSFHVTSPRDGERPDDDGQMLPALRFSRRPAAAEDAHPYASVVAERRRNRCVDQLARVLAAMKVPQATGPLDKCFALASTTTRDFIERTATIPRHHHAALGGRDALVRTHEGLIVSHRRDGNMATLCVETPTGLVEELAVNDVGGEAMAFVAREHMFEVRAMPGNLSDDERIAIVQALEETGLFKRVKSSGGRAHGERCMSKAAAHADQTSVPAAGIER